MEMPADGRLLLPTDEAVRRHGERGDGGIFFRDGHMEAL